MRDSIRDQREDLSGAERQRLQQALDAPDFVKQASVEDACGSSEQMQATLFADPINRLYPCHTKSATWLSAAFFAEQKIGMDADMVELIDGRIKKAAKYFAIAPTISAMLDQMEKKAAVEERALGDNDYALVWESDDGVKHREFPLRNAAEIKAASTWFKNYHTEFTFTDKHHISRKLLQKAASLGAAVDGSELLHKCAGYGYCPKDDLVNAWKLRSRLVKASNVKLASEIDSLVDILNTEPFDVSDHDTRVKMAALLDQCDRENGIRPLYDRDGVRVERPEDIVFRITEKVASEFLQENAQLTNGAIYEKAALASLNPQLIREHLGDEIADEFEILPDPEKIAEVLTTLPRGDADTLSRLAQSEGIVPVGVEKTAATPVDWSGVAAASTQ